MDCKAGSSLLEGDSHSTLPVVTYLRILAKGLVHILTGVLGFVTTWGSDHWAKSDYSSAGCQHAGRSTGANFSRYPESEDWSTEQFELALGRSK